jgi:hypothetical protein
MEVGLGGLLNLFTNTMVSPPVFAFAYVLPPLGSLSLRDNGSAEVR